jgi:cell division protein FtsA
VDETFQSFISASHRFTMKHPTETFVVGIDLGSHVTRVLVASPDGKELPRIVATGRASARGMRRGYVAHPGEAQQSLMEALSNAEKALGSEIRRAYASVSGVGLVARTVSAKLSVSRADGMVSETDHAALLRTCEDQFQAKAKNYRILHTIPRRYLLDGHDILAESPIGMNGGTIELEATVVACLRHHVDALIRVITDAGVDVIDIIAGPVALSIPTLSRSQRTAGCALMDIGAETVTLALFEHDALSSLAVFPLGSADVTNDLALGLQLGLSDAERVKIGRGSDLAPKRKVEEIVGARLEDMFELVAQHLKKTNRSGLLPAGLIITGAGSTLAPLADVAKATVRLPVQVVRMEHVLPTHKRELDTSWLTAYGLCALGDAAPAYSANGIGALVRNASGSMKSFLKQFLP